MSPEDCARLISNTALSSVTDDIDCNWKQNSKRLCASLYQKSKQYLKY